MDKTFLLPISTNSVVTVRVNTEAKFVMKLVILQRQLPIIPSNNGLCISVAYRELLISSSFTVPINGKKLANNNAQNQLFQ